MSANPNLNDVVNRDDIIFDRSSVFDTLGDTRLGKFTQILDMKNYFIGLSNRLSQIYDDLLFAWEIFWELIIKFLFIHIILETFLIMFGFVYLCIHVCVYLILGVFDLLYWVLGFHFWLFFGNCLHPKLSKRFQNGWFGKLFTFCINRIG